MGIAFLWGDNENVLNLIVVMLAQICEYTIVHFKLVSCVVCELYLNKAIFKNQIKTIKTVKRPVVTRG